MEIFKDLKKIWHGNNYHGAVVISILYLEFISRQKRENYGSSSFVGKIHPMRLFVILLQFTSHVLRRLIIQHLYNSEISPVNFRSKEGLTTLSLPHPYLIIINPYASLGCKCQILHNVTIGAKRMGDEKAAYLGDSVFVGCGSTILGGKNF